MENSILHYVDDAGRGPGIWSPPSLATGDRAAMIPRPRFGFGSLALDSLALMVGLLAPAIAGCGGVADDLFCDTTGCGFSDEQWARLSALANLGPPPGDPSNGVFDSPDARTLGQTFYQDARFSGVATQVDALGRPADVARAAKGQRINLSCASCHDLAGMGVDVASTPGNVSSGAGWTDVNALSTVNSAYQHLFFWNGRVDSLWALAFAVAESPTTMNGNRLAIAHVIADSYRAPYDAVFAPAPLGQPMPIPAEESVCALSPLVIMTGLTAGQCMGCPASCRAVFNGNAELVGCWPRFPLQGKPGNKAGCQPGDPTEPFGDAFDCMDPADQTAVTRVLANWAMALEAYQALLVNHEGTPFDRFINDGPRSTVIDESARRGAQLFVGKGGCVDCHDTPLFSDQGFHNIGVAQVGPNVPTLEECTAGGACDCQTAGSSTCLPWGRFSGLKKLAASKTLRTGKWSDDLNDMSRAADVATVPTDAMKGAWRTPSLRNVALTAPYMHDGRYATLEEVVWHYNRGGDSEAVGTTDVRIRPLGLTDGEQADLVAFLKTLSGPPLDPEHTTLHLPLPPTPVCP
jgi:cytochrome c peroxidase